ncbi:nucleotidyltransferase [uncultured Lacinutrix sp.]|uniref:nucleotidyltransferase n=1 Tax=uncultured Lacinutrix sp. TaxID=574032 RepID=UPI00261DB2E4|nr:nucleotidyltransferase [uncultured Lacinutrix sp.]
MNITKSEHLENVLQTHRMTHIEDLLKKYREKRQDIKEAIEAEYSSDIYNPLNSGSYAKHTAINSKFDLDVMIPFKRDAFMTLEEMFNDIFDFLQEKYGSVAEVIKQKVSIGIEFYADDNGDIISIDIVPGRELNTGQYEDDHKLNLYVNSNYGELEAQSYIQTNIHAQIDHIKSKDNERKIIRLFKVWKTTNNENYKSFLLELITIKAFDKENIKGNLWEKLKAVMEYIRDHITKDNFTLKDPGNGGNDIADTLEDYEKRNLSNKMKNMLERIEDNEDNLKHYFPTNPDFEDEDKNGNGYGKKSGAASLFSRPPKNERFG